MLSWRASSILRFACGWPSTEPRNGNALRVDPCWKIADNDPDMDSGRDQDAILITGAAGHIGRELCRVLRAAKSKVLPIDVETHDSRDIIHCDLRLQNDVSRVFQAHSIRSVVHLAAILPSAFRSDPLSGAEVNLNGSFELMRQAVNAGVNRLVFASSMSVYGSSPGPHPFTEDDPAVPDEPYGGSKRAVELIGETLADQGAVQFVSLRIARVIGSGIKKTSSPWRSQIFEPLSGLDTISVPFTAGARLSLVHAQDVARMLATLVEAVETGSFVYNTPAEIWQAGRLKAVIEELRGIHVELGPDGAHGGPLCDGSRFAREFGFQLRGLRDHLSSRTEDN